MPTVTEIAYVVGGLAGVVLTLSCYIKGEITFLGNLLNNSVFTRKNHPIKFHLCIILFLFINCLVIAAGLGLLD
ncbi:hypothetical protein [Spartinivicinus ruber]|uniref:hypothetical protein n=1 Tax=Spartinivicinus ruber TaxID=2683272 RepID=UPI0013D156B6|nr:hypothetical protein [Spartinivicinus ruber]